MRGGEVRDVRERGTDLVAIKQVEDELYNNIILKPKNICNPFSDPWLHHVHVHLVHVNLHTHTQGGVAAMSGQSTFVEMFGGNFIDFISFLFLLKNLLSCSELVPCSA